MHAPLEANRKRRRAILLMASAFALVVGMGVVALSWGAFRVVNWALTSVGPVASQVQDRALFREGVVAVSDHLVGQLLAHEGSSTVDHGMRCLGSFGTEVPSRALLGFADRNRGTKSAEVAIQFAERWQTAGVGGMRAEGLDIAACTRLLSVM
jgi:hypothetical protein